MPPDWFLGDETEAQKGLAPGPGQPTPTPLAELEKTLKKIKLPPGFKIERLGQRHPPGPADGVGRQRHALRGTFDKGIVYAVTDQGGKKVGEDVHQGPAHADRRRIPQRQSLRHRYRQASTSIHNAEANLDPRPRRQVVYDDMPPYVPHGWKYLIADEDGWFYIPFGPPCNVCYAPTACRTIPPRRPETGMAELIALGIRNSVGGDVDPRTGHLWFTENARDWISDDLPSDKLNHVSPARRSISAIPTATRATCRTRIRQGASCKDF